MAIEKYTNQNGRLKFNTTNHWKKPSRLLRKLRDIMIESRQAFLTRISRKGEDFKKSKAPLSKKRK